MSKICYHQKYMFISWIIISSCQALIANRPPIKLSVQKSSISAERSHSGTNRKYASPTTFAKNPRRNFNSVKRSINAYDIGRKGVIKREIWDNSWIPEGSQRENQILRIYEKQNKISKRFREEEKPLKKKMQNEVEEEVLNVLVEWAQVGEGKRCQNAADDFLGAVSQLNDYPDYKFHVKAYRRVLHAYYNQLQKVTWNRRYRKPKFKLTSQERRDGRELLQVADKILQKLENFSNLYEKSGLATSEILLQTSDYAPLILGYTHQKLTVPAAHTLRRLTSSFEKSGGLKRLIPGTYLYHAVMNSIFNCNAEQWAYGFGGNSTTYETIDMLCRECVAHTRQTSEDSRGRTILLPLYNIAFDAWSKVLPPLKKRNEECISLDKRKMKQMDLVANGVTELWQMMLEDNRVNPNSKTYISLIYAYTKSRRLEDAYSMVEPLYNYLLKNALHVRGDKLENVDSRALLTLSNTLVQNATNWSKMVEKTGNNKFKTTEIMVLAAERVERIIEILWELTEAGYDDVTPTVFLYTSAINAWARARCLKTMQRAETLFEDLKSRGKEDPENSMLKVDIFVYNALIKAIANQPNLINAADKAASIVKKIENRLDSSLHPDVNTFNGLIQAYLTSSDGIQKAEQTLEHLLKIGKPNPNETTFRLIIFALLESNTPDGVEKAEILLDRMEERFLPKAIIYEQIIFSWCKEKGKATRARKLLERMEQLFKAGGNESIRPSRSLYDTVIRALESQGEESHSIKKNRDEIFEKSVVNKELKSTNQVFTLLKEIDATLAGGTAPTGNTHNFNQVISVLAKSGKDWAGLRAEDILNLMLELTFKKNNENATPNIVTFNSVIGAWSKSGHALAGEKAADVMKKLDDLHDLGLLDNVVADRITYNTMMSAYAKSTDVKNSGQKAQTCFNELIKIYEETGECKYKPDIISFSTILNAWSRSSEKGAAQKAEKLLINMISGYLADPKSNPRPDTSCFNQVLYSWARSGEVISTKRAETILKLMQDSNKSSNLGIKPDTQTYNIVLLALSNSPGKESLGRVLELIKEMNQLPDHGKPNAVSYNTVISAFTKKGDINTAVEILDKLLTRDEVELDNKFFSSFIYSLSETEAFDAPIVAERVVNDLHSRSTLNVDTDICNALINCWGRINKVEGPLRAMDILEEMLDGKFGSEARPNVVTFTSVIDIWAKSGVGNAGAIAEEVLNLLKNTAGIVPNTQTYTATIQAFARSNTRDKARKAQEILERMKTDYNRGNHDAEPSIYTYNAVLNAAEFTLGDEEDKEEAFKIACEIFDEIQTTMRPDHVSYGSFMGVIAQLMPDGGIRNDMVQLLFRRCCVDGQVAPVVMKKFREAASIQQYHDLMGGVSEASLPKNWTCNVRRTR